MTKNEKRIYDCIVKVAGKNTDFQIGFDHLFGFMAENPESETTIDFIDFHEREYDDPVLKNGEADFTYLISQEFFPEDWVNKKDMPAFRKYVHRKEYDL